MSTWCLDVHAGWECRHSGKCCSAGWAIPIEAPAFERLRVHFGSGNIGHLFTASGHLPEGAAALVGTRGNGSCVFLHEDAATNRCEIQRTFGSHALPLACRQFPRMTLRDARGTFVTLSHFCPTAAALLLQPARLAIVEAPSGLALHGEVEGLDARKVLPPLLRPDMLTDVEGYDAWERCALDSLARRGSSAIEAVELIQRATRRIETWRPDAGPMRDAVRGAFDDNTRPEVSAPTSTADIEHFNIIVNSVPASFQRPDIPSGSPTVWAHASEWLEGYDRPVRAWLAARLFGNWIAYSAPGLRVVASALRTYHSVLRVEAVRQEQSHPQRPSDRRFVEAVRQADLLIVHLSNVRRAAALLARAG